MSAQRAAAHGVSIGGSLPVPSVPRTLRFHRAESPVTSGTDSTRRTLRLSGSRRRLEPAYRRSYWVPESHCGHYPGRQVRQSTRNPFRQVCLLLIYDGPDDASPARGTGWLAGPYTVITAGHCVWTWDRRRRRGRPPYAILVVPAANVLTDDGNRRFFRPFGWYWAFNALGQFHTVDLWRDRGDARFDCGAVVLKEPVGEQLQYFGFASLPAPELQRLGQVRIVGYPGDKELGTQWSVRGRLAEVDDYWLDYQLDTWYGDSGAPVFYRAEGGGFRAVGIHTRGGCPNSAVRITDELFDIIDGWSRLSPAVTGQPAAV